MPVELSAADPLARDAVAAIHAGDADALARLLSEHAGLAGAVVVGVDGTGRTLLHVVTDWPGRRPNAAAVVRLLADAGADVDAPFRGGAHSERALHWAASSDDLEALDALLEAGADIEAPGSVIDGGTALADAVAFGQWRAARRLVERGARSTLWQAAALGDRAGVERELAGADAGAITNAFWCACHGGQRATAELLMARGADVDWVGHDELTPLAAARRSGASELVAWLAAIGAH